MNQKTIKQKVKSKMDAIQWNTYLSKTEYTQRRITFGMHMGKKISDLPLDYLKWGILNLNDTWADYMSRELQRRNPKLR